MLRALLCVCTSWNKYCDGNALFFIYYRNVGVVI